MEKGETIRSLRERRLLLTLDGMLDPFEAARTAADAGVRAVEVLVDRDIGVLGAIARDHLGLVAGASGVATAQQAWDAVAAGARFVTAAPLTPEIAAVCEAADMAVVAAVVAEDAVRDALSLRPDLVRLLVAPADVRPEWPPLIVDVPGADPESLRRTRAAGVVVAVSARALGAASPHDLRRRLEALIHLGRVE